MLEETTTLTCADEIIMQLTEQLRSRLPNQVLTSRHAEYVSRCDVDFAYRNVHDIMHRGTKAVHHRVVVCRWGEYGDSKENAVFVSYHGGHLQVTQFAAFGPWEEWYTNCDQHSVAIDLCDPLAFRKLESILVDIITRDVWPLGSVRARLWLR